MLNNNKKPSVLSALSQICKRYSYFPISFFFFGFGLLYAEGSTTFKEVLLFATIPLIILATTLVIFNKMTIDTGLNIGWISAIFLCVIFLSIPVSGQDVFSLIVPIILIYIPDFVSLALSRFWGLIISLAFPCGIGIWYFITRFSVCFTDAGVDFFTFLPFKYMSICLLNCAMLFLWFLYDKESLRNTSKHVEELKDKAIQEHTHLKEQNINTIVAIEKALAQKDIYTGKHSERVAFYSALIAQEVGYNERQIRHIKLIALVHDIGKIGIPDSILKKSKLLTKKEYEIIKTHTTIGAEILKHMHYPPGITEGALYHHERWDGKGYPRRLKGDQIPLNSRIIGLADAYDAMTLDRPYQKGQSDQYVVAQLKNERGKQFDPELVDVMIKLIEEDKIYFVEDQVLL